MPLPEAEDELGVSDDDSFDAKAFQQFQSQMETDEAMRHYMAAMKRGADE